MLTKKIKQFIFSLIMASVFVMFVYLSTSLVVWNINCYEWKPSAIFLCSTISVIAFVFGWISGWAISSATLPEIREK